MKYKNVNKKRIIIRNKESSLISIFEYVRRDYIIRF